jgi:hypothetical protein
MNWNQQQKLRVLGEESVPVSHFPPQIPQEQTKSSTVGSAQSMSFQIILLITNNMFYKSGQNHSIVFVNHL